MGLPVEHEGVCRGCGKLKKLNGKEGTCVECWTDYWLGKK